MLMAATPALAASSSLGLAGNYNVFVFGNYSTGEWGSGHIHGNLAAGGNVTAYSLSVAQDSSTSKEKKTLVVGGSFKADQGNLFKGEAHVGTTWTNRSASTFTLNPGTSLTENSSPIDFAAQRTKYQNMSTSLAALAATGTVVDTDGNYGMEFVGDGTNNTQIFNIAGSMLQDGTYSAIDGLFDTASNATVVINVSGSIIADNISSVKQSFRDYAGTVLFNFYEATSLTLNGEFWGSILAPYADVVAGGGEFHGTLIAESFTGTRQFHNLKFTGEVPTPIPGSIALLGTGLIGLLGWRKRR